ncbi:MAG: hypothetical protein AAB217_26715 [Chloroflexota bacterium]|mgnify:CR=1 FL=1
MTPKVIIADEEKFWRDLEQKALEEMGCQVDVLPEATTWPPTLDDCPDAVLVGFSDIGQRAETLLADVLKTCPRATVLVLSTTWPVSLLTERRLLRLGAANVVARPRTLDEIAGLVKEEVRANQEAWAALSSYARFRLQGEK